MEAEAAKYIGAGIACIALAGAGIGIGARAGVGIGIGDRTGALVKVRVNVWV